MNSGSFFFEEISRMMSSLRPGAMASASMSVTNPHSYSRLTAASTVFAVVLIVTPWRTYSDPALRGKGCAAPAGRLRIRIDEREPGLEALLDVVDRCAVQIEVAFRVAHDGDAVDRELLVVRVQLVVEVELVREARAPVALHARAQDDVVREVLGPLELLDLLGRCFRKLDRHGFSGSCLLSSPAGGAPARSHPSTRPGSSCRATGRAPPGSSGRAGAVNSAASGDSRARPCSSSQSRSAPPTPAPPARR